MFVQSIHPSGIKIFLSHYTIFISLYIDTRERLIRFKVVAEYHRINSKGVSFVIQPDQSIAQIIPNVRSVSIARKTNGL
jgi:hypothetical protein